MQAWVIGNWKQNPATSHDVKALLDDLLTAVSTKEQSDIAACQLMVAPSFIHLTAVNERLKGSSVLCKISARIVQAQALILAIVQRSKLLMLAQHGRYWVTLSAASTIKNRMTAYCKK